MLDSEKLVDPQDEKKLKARGIGSGEDYDSGSSFQTEFLRLD